MRIKKTDLIETLTKAVSSLAEQVEHLKKENNWITLI